MTWRASALEEIAHRHVHTHMKIGYVLCGAIAGLAFWRWLIFRGSGSPAWSYFIAAAAVLALTLFQGWLGGELTFGHGVGVAPTGQGTEPAARAQRRLYWLDRAKHPRRHEPHSG